MTNTDSERLDWVQKNRAEVGPCTLRNTRSWYVEWLPDGKDVSSRVVTARTPRAAVDRAMEATAEKRLVVARRG